MDEVRLINATTLEKEMREYSRYIGYETTNECESTAECCADMVSEAPTVDPESLRPKTSMKYDASTRTVTCRNCSGEAKLGEYDNPEDFRYCPFCGFKVEDLTYDVY
jgi:hypothetical protein